MCRYRCVHACVCVCVCVCTFVRACMRFLYSYIRINTVQYCFKCATLYLSNCVYIDLHHKRVRFGHSLLRNTTKQGVFFQLQEVRVAFVTLVSTALRTTRAAEVPRVLLYMSTHPTL